jgi:MFS family permease
MTIPGAAQPRGWYHGWSIVAVCVLSQAAANGLPVNAFSLFLREWSAQLHAPISTLQLGLAALGLFSAVFSPMVGVLADKYSARWLTAGGAFGIAIFYISVSFVTSTAQLLALFMLLLPVSLTFCTALVTNALISRWFVRRLGLALGLSAFGIGIAGVALPPIVAAVVPIFGWRNVWRGAGALIAVTVVPLLLWIVRDRPTERDGLHYINVDGAPRSAHGHSHTASGTDGLKSLDIIKRRNFLLLLAAYIPMLALYGGCMNNLAPIATSRGLTQQTAGMLLSGFSFAHVSATLLAGLLSDRFGNRLPLFGLAMATAIGGFIVAFSSDTTSLALGVMLVGLSGGMWPLLAAAIAREFGASGVGRGFGLLMLFLPVVGLAPFGIAKLQETTASYAPGLGGLAALTLAAALACLLMKERPQGPTARRERLDATHNVVAPEA